MMKGVSALRNCSHRLSQSGSSTMPWPKKTSLCRNKHIPGPRFGFGTVHWGNFYIGHSRRCSRWNRRLPVNKTFDTVRFRKHRKLYNLSRQQNNPQDTTDRTHPHLRDGCLYRCYHGNDPLCRLCRPDLFLFRVLPNTLGIPEFWGTCPWPD